MHDTIMAKTIQTTGTKHCKGCDTTKPIDEFYLRNKTSMRRHSTCKECDKNRISKTYWEDPSVYQNSHLKRNYGITLNDYNQMLTEQNDSCAICKTTEPGGKHGKFMVDHCHTTGNVRGLLCKRCNIALGEVEDNTQTLQSMIDYLKRP